MKFIEKDLEEIIFKTSRDKLLKRGLPIEQNVFRQLRIGNYGVSDLIAYTRCREGFNPYLQIGLYELKKNVVDENTFFQAVRYARGIQHYLKQRNFKDYTLSINLIGSSINFDSSVVFLTSLFPEEWLELRRTAVTSVNIYTYEYEFDGIKFYAHRDYVNSNDGFNALNK